MTPIDRDRLARALWDNTPVTLEQFERIHGPATDRPTVEAAYRMWRAWRDAFPDILVWKIRPIE